MLVDELESGGGDPGPGAARKPRHHAGHVVRARGQHIWPDYLAGLSGRALWRRYLARQGVSGSSALCDQATLPGTIAALIAATIVAMGWSPFLKSGRGMVLREVLTRTRFQSRYDTRPLVVAPAGRC